MKRICVYSGSNAGLRSEYRGSAITLGNVLVENGIELVYGGSNVGLMGEIAHQVLKRNGRVTGVIPKGLFPDRIVSSELTRLIEVKDMHERKKTMADLSDGFIALPGGIGTFEELFEILTWAQLGIHNKPVAVLNVAAFYDPLVNLLKNTTEEGFMNESSFNLLLVSSDPQELVAQMKNYEKVDPGLKWRDLAEKRQVGN